ncbi:hypothetical protein ABZP36_023408, partial [Zizania latifolia]
SVAERFSYGEAALRQQGLGGWGPALRGGFAGAGGDLAEFSSDSSVWDLRTMAAVGGGGGDRVDGKYNSYKAPGLRGATLEAAHVSCLEDRYALGPQLGWGQFGVIRSCSDMVTGEALACKSIAKDRLVSPDDVRGVKLEIEVMVRLSGHPNVIDLKAVYEDESSVHLVMELCAGGELFHRLEECGCFSEHGAAMLFCYLMEVVAHCHSKGIVHRDLKPENILLVSKFTIFTDQTRRFWSRDLYPAWYNWNC